MKEKIKEILREDVSKNSLGVVVTRPDQELIIMRGISGSGKSTKAKSLVKEGVIHSTDEVIESLGDYREFFAKMIKAQEEKKDNAFAPLHKAHGTNFRNAVNSMKSGISPVIIDNTNLKANEAKNYVVEALKLGYSDSNIKIVDVGTGGLDAEALAKRNSHGVPLEKIKAMIESHKSVGELTLKKILESKDMFKENNVLYSAIVLTDKSRSRLLSSIGDLIPKEWDIIAHHMTIVFGKELPVELKPMLGKEVELTAHKVGFSDKAMSVLVAGFKTLTGKMPHITIAVNRKEGAKPVMGGEITEWSPITPIGLTGVVTEIKKQE